jgi:hypothetical protein
MAPRATCERRRLDQMELDAIECDARAPEREEDEIEFPYYVDLEGGGPAEAGDGRAKAGDIVPFRARWMRPSPQRQ